MLHYHISATINQGMEPTENNGRAHTGQMLHHHISATINQGIDPTENNGRAYTG